MARGYKADDIKQRLVEILGGSETGLSGVEISDKLKINRVTMTKYLEIFAAEGLVRKKNVGNITLWLADNTEQFRFPDDYFQVQKKYLDSLLEYSENKTHALVRNCLHSGAKTSKLMTEVIIPAVKSVGKLYDDGKIGSSELGLLHHTIYSSIQLTSMQPSDADPRKNAILMAADSASTLLCESASTALKRANWKVSTLGDMSSSINVLLDLDLQKLLGKVWKQKPGIMIIVIFSNTEGGLNFFAESARSAKSKTGKNIRLVLCGKVGKKTSIKSDFITDDLDAVLQWSQTAFEGLTK